MKHDEECHCKQLHVLLYGTRPDQTDGLLHICLQNSDALYGTTENPGGLVRQGREAEQMKWKIVGACAVITPVGGFVGAWLMKILTAS